MWARVREWGAEGRHRGVRRPWARPAPCPPWVPPEARCCTRSIFRRPGGELGWAFACARDADCSGAAEARLGDAGCDLSTGGLLSFCRCAGDNCNGGFPPSFGAGDKEETRLAGLAVDSAGGRTRGPLLVSSLIVLLNVL